MVSCIDNTVPFASESQTASAVLMIRPLYFGWNAETAVSNTYQQRTPAPPSQILRQALQEFDAMQALLVRHGVAVTVFDDLPSPHTPDALFPNNWFSTHGDGTLVFYPMAADNRRAERRPHLIDALRRKLGSRRVVDLTNWEAQGKFLEGTGSLVLDRVHRVAYAALSGRTDRELVEVFAAALGYRSLPFATVLHSGQPIYHTNVLMTVGTTTAVVCLDAIADDRQRDVVASALRESGRQVVAITIDQMNDFAGNLLELRSQNGARLWVMSTRAFSALRPEQRDQLARDAALLHTPLPTIENVGGGSARCMLGELFHPSPPSPI